MKIEKNIFFLILIKSVIETILIRLYISRKKISMNAQMILEAVFPALTSSPNTRLISIFTWCLNKKNILKLKKSQNKNINSPVT